MVKTILTKADLSAIKELIDTSIDTKVNRIVDAKIKESEKRLERRLEIKIIEFKDEILGEIRSLRDEVTIVTGYKNQLEDHEDRLTKVEKHLRITPPPTTY